MLVVIDHWEVGHRAHEASAEHVQKLTPRRKSQTSPMTCYCLPVCFPLLSELFNLRVYPNSQREQDEREDLSGGEDAPQCDPPVALAIP